MGDDRNVLMSLYGLMPSKAKGNQCSNSAARSDSRLSNSCLIYLLNAQFKKYTLSTCISDVNFLIVMASEYESLEKVIR